MTVEFELRCSRRGHVIAKILDQAGTLYVDAQPYVWRVHGEDVLIEEQHRPLEDETRGSRYGCACGRSALVSDGEIRRAVSTGKRKLLVVLG